MCRWSILLYGNPHFLESVHFILFISFWVCPYRNIKSRFYLLCHPTECTLCNAGRSYNVVSSGNFLPTFQDKSHLKGSVIHYSLYNNPEEHSSHMAVCCEGERNSLKGVLIHGTSSHNLRIRVINLCLYSECFYMYIVDLKFSAQWEQQNVDK
jgi:hypothetical protein